MINLVNWSKECRNHEFETRTTEGGCKLGRLIISRHIIYIFGEWILKSRGNLHMASDIGFDHHWNSAS